MPTELELDPLLVVVEPAEPLDPEALPGALPPLDPGEVPAPGVSVVEDALLLASPPVSLSELTGSVLVPPSVPEFAQPTSAARASSGVMLFVCWMDR